MKQRVAYRTFKQLLCGTAIAVASLSFTSQAAAELTPAILTQKIQAATAGEMSLDELAEFLLREAEQSDSSLKLLVSEDRKVPGFGQHISDPLLKHLQESVSKGEDDKALRQVELAKKFIPVGTSNGPVIEKIGTWLANLHTILQEGNVQKFIELYHADNDSVVAPAFESRLEVALRQLAESIAAKQQPLQALAMLAELDAATSKPVLNEIGQTLLPKAIEVLSGTTSVPEWPFTSQEAQDFLRSLARANATGMSQVLQMLRLKVLQDVAHNQAVDAQWYFNLILGLRPDPNPENNQLRKEIAFTADGADSKKFADGRLEELRAAGALGVFTRLRLATAGSGGKLVRVIVVTLEILFLALVTWFGWRTFVRMQAAKALRKSAPKKRSSKSKGYDQPMERDDEYTRLLAGFGLDDSATEADIKRAFREAVKRHHPDVQGSEGVMRDDEGNVDDTFQELRRNYERLLEVRGGWFGRKA